MKKPAPASGAKAGQIADPLALAVFLTRPQAEISNQRYTVIYKIFRWVCQLTGFNYFI
jgi:hypothetical protein